MFIVEGLLYCSLYDTVGWGYNADVLMCGYSNM